MEFMVLLAFALTLTVCMVLGLPLLLALVLGYCIFFGYGLYQKHTVFDLLRMSLTSIRTAKNILILFFMIGLLTALWRAGGDHTGHCLLLGGAGPALHHGAHGVPTELRVSSA